MRLSVSTKEQQEVVDITRQVQQSLDQAKFKSGAVVINVLHTTCAVAIAELDPGTDQDLLDFLESLIPNIDWRHSHDPGHVSAHLLSTLIGTSLILPVEGGKVVLGTWQSIVLIELNGPKDREVSLSLIGSNI